jgi:hypothetical protein
MIPNDVCRSKYHSLPGSSSTDIMYQPRARRPAIINARSQCRKTAGLAYFHPTTPVDFTAYLDTAAPWSSFAWIASGFEHL